MEGVQGQGGRKEEEKEEEKEAERVTERRGGGKNTPQAKDGRQCAHAILY